MKRKLLCLIMVLTLAFADFSANANALNGNLDVIADKLSEFTSQDRQNLMTIVYPLIIIDDGIDTLIKMVDEHNPHSDGMFDQYIGDVLQYVSKEDIIFMLRSIKIVSEDIRKEYLRGFMDREELDLSEENAQRMDAFMKIAYSKSSELESIITEDGITNGVIAKLFTVIPAINGGMPVLCADGRYNFSPYYISGDMSAKWNSLCAESGVDADIKESVTGLSEYFNSNYSPEHRENVAKLFSELGICYLRGDEDESFKNVVYASNSQVTYPAVYTYFKDGSMLYRTEMVMKDISSIVFRDIDGWYKDCVTELAYMGIVAGRGDGMFYPNDYVTREEFVKMICAAINLPSIDAATPFADVNNNAWYGRYIRTAYNYKIINGQSADTFGVGQNISRQDAAVICNNILKNVSAEKKKTVTFGDADTIAPYAFESVYHLAEIGVINGDDKGNFNAASSITRAESAKIINELIHIIANIK